MAEKLNLARIKKFGETFEISVDPDKALQYKKGEINDLREVLLADNIFTDAKKGKVAGNDELQKAFQTTDPTKIADVIVKEGEIQLTSEHRAAEREQRRKKLINLIHRQAIDPKTGLPHPPTRIELALEQGKINLDDHKSVEDQFDDIISKLRPIIPISIEEKEALLVIPAQYTGKAYNFVKSGAKIQSEEWTNEGNWKVKITMPAGMYPDFIEKLNGMTHGEVVEG
jgi:ribosome maturation protein SDO1